MPSVENEQESQRWEAGKRRCLATEITANAPNGTDLTCVLEVGHQGTHRDPAGGYEWQRFADTGLTEVGDVDTGLADEVERLRDRLVREHIAANKPTEIELIGQMSAALEQIPEDGRAAALRYLADRYAIMPRFQ